ncbi:MAG: tryptophan synthase subunit alpha [Bacteroidetes bacterium]|nr:tryptophan synthase subunit alpha [Bacteroidota bacterium]
MNRLDALFSKKKQQVLNMYCTAGFPQVQSTMEVLQALQKGGADIIEIGMPYSDPLADGEVIQHSSSVALQNGMTMQVLFQQLQQLRNNIAEGGIGHTLPVLLMGYMNPVLQYGIEQFCADAAAAGVDGVILPDLPMFEYETMYKKLFEQHHLHFIFLVTPETSDERIKKIDQLCSGFVYAVSSSSTTGKNKAIEAQQDYFKRLQQLQLQNPILVGFGIKDHATFTAACAHTNGAIIGSAYIKALENSTDIAETTNAFIAQVRG